MTPRILVLGAGALGGIYGGRLLEAGGDVTFLVRPRRAAQLAADGLVVESPDGAIRRQVRVLAPGARGRFDLILLSCKAYDLDDAIAALAPHCEGAAVVPMLNGLAHLEALAARLPAATVTGGVAYIGATMTPDGVLRHLSPRCKLVFGRLDGAADARLEALAALYAGTKVTAEASGTILQEMWNKFVMLATLAAATTLIGANIMQVVAAGGAPVARRLLRECEATAMAADRRPPAAFLERTLADLTDPASTFSSSMLRDMQAGGRTEAAHILGDMLRRAEAANVDAILLRAAFARMQAYEAARTG